MPTLNNIGDFALFKSNDPFYHVTQIRDYSVDLEGTVASLEFRWSIDNATYSAWVELTMDNLRDVVLDPEQKLYIEFRATLVSGGPVTVDNFQVDLEQEPWDQYEGYVPPCIDCNECGNLTGVTRIQDLCFKPYEVNAASCLFTELSYMVNTLFGHDTEYFRSVPNKAAQDITLKEYTLYDVDPSKCVKLMVPNNEFPDSKLSFNPFGIDFESPFEVEVDKAYWEEIFGHDTGPQKQDIVYFPINGRIYEVLSSYLFKAFMEKDAFWKVSLIKYQPKASRYEPEGVRDLIDGLTTDTSEIFEEELREQEEKYTKPQQYNRFIGNDKYDPSRKAIDPNLKVIEKRIVNFSTVIAEYYYSMNNLVKFNDPVQSTIVEYHEPVRFTSDQELAYSAWFSESAPTVFNPSDLIELMALDTNTNQLTIQLTKSRNYLEGEYIQISRTGGLNLYGIVKTVLSASSYILQLSSDIVSYLDTYNLTWSGLSNYKATKTVPHNLLNGYDASTQKGIRFDLLVNRYVRLTMNDKEYIYPMDIDLARDKWYGVFINISNRFRQSSVGIWERKWVDGEPAAPQTTELFNIYNKTINQIAPEDRVNEGEYGLLASNMNLTNIRLYNHTAEVEKQSTILNQNIVNDAQNALIIDNALPSLKLPFIAQSK